MRHRPEVRREVVGVVAAGIALTALLVATANPGPAQVNDTRAAALSSWSLGTRGELALPAPWPASANYWGVTTPDGRVHVNRFPGVALWAAPAYALHDLTDDRPPPAHPFLVDLRPAAWSAAVTVAAAVLLAYGLLRRTVPRRWAAAGAATLGLGTSLWSVAADALWPHGPTALTLTGLLLAWRRDTPVLAAIAAAGAVLVRPHLVVATVVIAAGVAWREPGRRAVAVAVLAGSVLGLAVLSLYSQVVFGVATPTAGYDVAGHLGGLVDRTPQRTVGDLALALVGPRRGVLTWSPVLAVAAAAAIASRRRLPDWTVTAALAGLAYLLVQVRAVGHLGGADFYGARVSLETVVLAAPLLVAGAHAAVASASGRRRTLVGLALVGAAIASIGVHAYGAVWRSIAPHQVARWEVIDATVRREFGDLELGEVDLRPPRSPSGAASRTGG